MKTRKIFAALLLVLMVASMLLSTALSAMAALNDPNNVKTIGLTLTTPVAGAAVDLSYDSVICAAPMEYKVVGVDWYKDNATDFMNDRLGREDNDDHFIGGHNYTVKVTLKTKGDRKWNLDFKQNGDTDYSHITATINGVTATLEPHQVSPESTDMLCVCYTFEDIAVGEFTPYVSIGTPVAGKTKNDVIIAPYSERQMYLAPWGEDCNWYQRINGQWMAMDADDTFAAGEDYRLIATFYANVGFRFSAQGTHTVGDDGYIYGYVNGKQMSMKLEKYAGNFLYDSVTFTYDFVSCEAQELDEVSFGGIAAPVAGQHPQYAVTMGDDTYFLVTDPAINGGAQYGFVDGIAWANKSGTPLNEQSVFEAGASYVLSFFIKADDIYRFSDFVEGGANVGYVSVQTMDNPTLAFVSVEFAPCGGGVMTEINVGGVTEPVYGAKPDYDFTYGQGYDKADADPSIVWFDLTANKELTAEDTFEYGHTYELLIIVRSDKAINGNAGEFEFAPIGTLKAKINGKDVGAIMARPTYPETHYVQLAMTFECAKAPVTKVDVTVENPMEGKRPAQQIKLGDDTYVVESFMFEDEDGTMLYSDATFVGAKNYFIIVSIAAKEGYQIAEGVTTPFINGQEAAVIEYGVDHVVFATVLMADELPVYFIMFDPNEGMGSMDDIAVKSGGTIELPACELTAPDGKQFLCWSTDGTSDTAVGQTMTVEAGVGGSITLYAVWEDSNQHTHVYGDEFNDWDDAGHYKTCVSPNCPQLGSWETRSNEPGDSMSHHYDDRYANCDTTCEDCGYVRTTQNNGMPLHEYTHACSEVCWACGFARETTHTPGAAATCTEDQTCTVCNKVLESAKGHTAGEAANCGFAQKCTVCGVELAPIQGEHVPGAAANCTEAQKCTVCGAELAPAKGHTAGVEWLQDENGHWHICADCGNECDRAEHKDDDGDELCDACDYDLSDGIPGWAIALIVVGGVLLLGGGGFFLMRAVNNKKKMIQKKASGRTEGADPDDWADAKPEEKSEEKKDEE